MRLEVEGGRYLVVEEDDGEDDGDELELNEGENLDDLSQLEKDLEDLEL